MGFPECQQSGLDRAGVGSGPIYGLVNEIMTVAFWIGSLVFLDVILVLWMKKRLQKIERLPWW
jgi:uncharacterized membrane protein YkvI